MNKSIFICIILTVVLLASCKSTKTIQKAPKPDSFEQLVTERKDAEPKFTTMNASNTSISVNLNGQQINVSASLRIITDSVIVLSITPFMGIELFSVELYPDHWILFDKLNKDYYTDNYEYLFYRFGIRTDFYMFQSIFSAQLFFLSGDKPDKKKCKYETLENNKNLIICEYGQITQTVQTAEDHSLEQLKFQNKDENFSFNAVYSDYMVTKGVKFPRKMNFDALALKGNINLQMNLNIQKVTFNTELKISFSNPQRYNKKTLDQLL